MTKKHRQLRAAGQELREAQKSNPYLTRSLDLRSQGNLIVAKHLLNAFDAVKRTDFVAAEEHVAIAKRLAPEWYEVHRVDALVKAAEGNVTGAQQAFEGAVDLEPGSAPLRLRYGMFKLEHLDDPPAAIDELLLALKIDPDSLDCRLELVRAYQRDLAFEAARRQLNVLFDRASDLSQLRLRMLHDLEMQQWMRLADRLSLSGDHDRSSRALESMKRAFRQCPDKIRDAKIRSRLMQAVPTARRILRYTTDDEVKVRARGFVDWVESGSLISEKATSAGESARSRGVVVKLLSEHGYGFIRLRDGDEVFLHFSKLEFDKDELAVGDELVFGLGPGRDGGVQAVQVSRA